jgi:hypothetical protein
MYVDVRHMYLFCSVVTDMWECWNTPESGRIVVYPSVVRSYDTSMDGSYDTSNDVTCDTTIDGSECHTLHMYVYTLGDTFNSPSSN